MRFLVAFVLVLLLGVESQGADPPVTVTNKTVTVVNKTAPPKSKICPCGDNCVCASQECPACPAQLVAASKGLVVTGYRQECVNGRCQLVPVYGPPAEMKSGVVTYTRRVHPDTAGRMCLWDWPSDPNLKPVFLGYCSGSK